MRIATLGAALSGNKGAASMIEALVEHFAGEATVVLLTTYPDDDRRLAADGVEIVPLGPIQLVARDLPVALLGRLAPRRWRPRLYALAPAVDALSRADVVADISGVSFVDHRGWKFHIYNALLALLPILTQTPVVKCAQAIGPFHQRLNRVLAKWLLPRVDHILARGDQTLTHVTELGVSLRKIERAGDLAFTLGHDSALQPELVEALDALGERDVVMVMPSAVVDGWCARHDIDHPGVLAEVVSEVCDRLGAGVMLVPHAYRATGKPRRMDDARVCREIAARLGPRGDVVLVDRDLPPSQLRALVAHVDLLVASRFHGMVEGLAAGTPTLVLGWGHKYAEVLAQFRSEEFALDYAALASPETVVRSIETLWAQRDAVRERLAAAAPAVIESASVNFAALRAAGART